MMQCLCREQTQQLRNRLPVSPGLVSFQSSQAQRHAPREVELNRFRKTVALDPSRNKAQMLEMPVLTINPGLPHCRRILYQLSHKGSPRILEWVAYPFSRGSSQPRDKPRSSTFLADSLPAEPPEKPKNTGMGSLPLLQQIFLTQGSNQDLLH